MAAVSEQHSIRILCVDDHLLVREGMAAVITEEPDMRVVAEAANGQEAIARFRSERPDVTLMDLRLPDMSGVDAILAITREFPDARIVVVTSSEGDVDIRRSFAAGARGYVLKGMPRQELLEVIRMVHTGKKWIPAPIAARIAEYYTDDALSAREIEVLGLVAGGSRNKEIADRLSISEDTVKTHLKNIIAKLGALDRTHAVTIGLRRGIIHL